MFDRAKSQLHILVCVADSKDLDESVSDRTRRLAIAYVDGLDPENADDDSYPRSFDECMTKMLERYGAEIALAGNRVVGHRSAELLHGQFDYDDPRAREVALLIAAELDFCSPLHARQNLALAEIFEALGDALSTHGLTDLSVLAFRRATRLYALSEDRRGEERCGIRFARANTAATKSRVRRWAGHAAFLLCGYGYRPSYLLGWVVGQVLVFTAVGLLLAGDIAWTTTVYLTVTAFLDPIGPDDARAVGSSAHPLFALESWMGAVSMSVFFALLVRKWFRL